MEGWRALTIGDLCDAGFATVQTGPFGSQLHASDYVADGVPVVPTEAIRDRRILESELPQIDQSTVDRLSRHKLRSGDILFARRGVQATGHCALVLDQHEGWLCGTGAILLRLIGDNLAADPLFLSIALASEDARTWFQHHAIGATMPNLNEGIVRRFPLLLPPLPEQRAIAGVLGALDDKIEANRRMNATLEALARALFKSWFVDFDPVYANMGRAKMDRSAEGATTYEESREPAIAPVLDRSGIASDAGGLAALFPARLTDSPLGPIPEGWEVKRFDFLAEAISDVAKADELQGDENYIGLEHLPRRSISLDAWDHAAGLESHKARFAVGDTLFGKLRPYFHKVGRALVDGVCSTDIVVVRARRSMHAAVSLMIASSSQFVAFNDLSSTGTKMPRTSWGRMSEFEVAVPPDAVCKAFEVAVSPMLERLGSSIFQSRTLAQLRDLVLPKLLSGALRVRDVDRMIGDAA